MSKPIYLLTSATSRDVAEFIVLSSTKTHIKLKGSNRTYWVTLGAFEDLRPVLVGRTFLWFKLYYQKEVENDV